MSEIKKNDKYYLAMSTIVPHNPFFKAKLFEFFNFDIEKMFNATGESLNEFAKKYDNVKVPKNFLQKIDESEPEKLYEEVNDKGIKYITYENGFYPCLLKNICDFPLMLYYKGSFDNINFEKTVACVGSRRASAGAKESLIKIINEMRGADIVIVSGLAEGIDTQAHKAAINNNLKTVAVIGSGLKYTYPSSNKILYGEIENRGLILSEYPYDMSPLPVQFPLRNRIVTGISKGTIVGEAKIKSGAMISAKLALDEGRELMCIPGLITNPNTEGIYYLVKNGASIVTSASDVFEILGFDDNVQLKLFSDMSEFEEKIVNIVSIEPKSIEMLVNQLNCDISELMVNLTQMELKGLIKQINGTYYISG